MTATPVTVTATEEDLAGPVSAYAAITVPYEGPATLSEADDYDSGRTTGWVLTYTLDEFDLPFRYYVAMKDGWKVIQVAEAHGLEVEPDVPVDIDPNALVGDKCNVRIDWQNDPDKLKEDEVNYREIKFLFPVS